MSCPVPKEDVTVVIAAKDEEATIGEVLRRLERCGYPHAIVIDDGSTDRTAAIAQKFTQYLVESIFPNGGKGAAMARALPLVNTPYIAFHDADLEYSVEAIEDLLAVAGDYDMVVGQRTMPALSVYRDISVGSFLANKFFATLLDSPDVLSGQRVLSRGFAQSLDLVSRRFAIETEISCKAKKRGARVTHVPVPYHPRTKEEGKKIGVVDFFDLSFRLVRELYL